MHKLEPVRVLCVFEQVYSCLGCRKRLQPVVYIKIRVHKVLDRRVTIFDKLSETIDGYSRGGTVAKHMDLHAILSNVFRWVIITRTKGNCDCPLSLKNGRTFVQCQLLWLLLICEIA